MENSEKKNLYDITIGRLKDEMSGPGTLWMGDDICLVDVSGRERMKYFSNPCRIDAFMAVYCIQGRIRLTVNLNEFEMNENTLFLNNAGNIVKVNEEVDDSDEQLRYISLIVSKKLMHDLRIDVNKLFDEGVRMVDDPCLTLSREDVGIASAYVSLLASLMVSSSPYRKDGICSLISSFFYYLAGIRSERVPSTDSALSSTNRGRQVFDRFIRLVSENYMKYRNVGFYADRLCLTPKYLSKLIKTTTGRSAPEWIDAYVILEAKNMLKYSSSTIKEIVYSLNFPNQSVFYKFFKARTGMTPSEYRNS